MATSEGIPSSIDIEFLELNDNPYFSFNNSRVFELSFNSSLYFFYFSTSSFLTDHPTNIGDYFIDSV